MKKKLVAILIQLLFLGGLSAQEQMLYSVRHYSVADGLSQNTVMSILQDRDGFMWFGTWDGVNRFDGYEFKTYKPTFYGEQLASNRVDFLHEDSLGFIWMRTYGGSFYRLNKHTEHILAPNVRDTRLGNTFQRAEQCLLLEAANGEIWVAGDNTLLQIRETESKDVTEQTNYSLHGDISFIIGEGAGCVWAGTTKGLECIQNGKRSTFTPGKKEGENNISCGYNDGKLLWFGTENGLIWRYSPRSQRFERIDLGLHSRILRIASPDDYTLVIATQADGFVVCDKSSGSKKVFSQQTSPVIHSNCFEDIYVDRSKSVWLVNEERGVLRYRPQDNSITRYTANIDERYNYQLAQNFFAFEDKRGRLWINPQGGGFSFYNPRNDRLESPLGGITNMIHSAYVAQNGTMWLGTYDLGLDKLEEKPRLFTLHDLRPDRQHSGEPRALIQTKDGKLILATKDKQVRVFNDKLVYESKLPISARVYTMLEAADGSLLLGSKGDGLFVYQNGTVTNYRASKNEYSLLQNDIYDLCYGPDSTLYIATFGGGINILKNGRFIHEENDWSSYPSQFGARVRALQMVNDTTLFAATTAGLLRVNTRTLETQETPYFDIRALHLAKDGHLWVGTFGGGLLEIINPMAGDLLADENLTTYNSTNGLLSDIVLSIVRDPASEDLWFTTEDGLSHMFAESRTFQHFSALGQEKGTSFSEAEGIATTDGNILFGYSQGVCQFVPSMIFHTDESPRIQFTRFLLFNKTVEPTEDGPLPDAICYAPKITLSHTQSVFSIEYAALAYNSDGKVQYAYKMDGVDSDWNYVGNLRRATYTQLRHGTYTFRVRSTNSEGVWADNERTLTIKVNPSFWLTPWAAIFYVLILAFLAGILYQILMMYSKLREEVLVEQKVTDIKLRFFTNISHELRTPLTLISGPVEHILKNEKISPSVRSQLEIVESNSARMLRLINQILDFRKIQNKKMRLKIQQTNVKKLVADTCSNFSKEAYDKHINFSIENEVPDAVLWLDRDKTDTILFNLLSNAFKYTPEDGTITVKVSERKDYILLTVQDTGAGIPLDKRNILFERFSSQNEIKNKSDKPGTGIGLNLVKELVDLHKGYIEVESEVGKGSTFTVLFHTGKEHFGTDVDLIVNDSMAAEEASDTTIHDNSILDLKPISDNRHHVLVVDDNEDMCHFLENILNTTYNVTTACDGRNALEKIGQQMPDMIVSDLMMPNMDGLELTDHIKTNEETSHIPVVLLTAKSAIESRLEALKYGADDYITKPFSPEYLLARLDNILLQRKRLQETYRSTLLSLNPTQPKEQSPDEAFLAHLLNFMEQNMDNSELAVDDLVHEMALGRTVFFNKLKSLTGLSPVEFIREVRIKRAAQLLESGNYNITEITYMIGMSDSRYFAKCFKTAYGVTPTEYRKSMEKKDA